MKCHHPMSLKAIIITTFFLFAGLAGFKTEAMARNPFPSEKRVALQPGGPHKGTADTLAVVVNYRYHVDATQPPERIMHIEGGISGYKIKAESMMLHINFLDDQGATISRHLVYALGHKQGRDTFIRPKTTFAKKFEVPADSVSFAMSSMTRRSRGRR